MVRDALHKSDHPAGCLIASESQGTTGVVTWIRLDVIYFILLLLTYFLSLQYRTLMKCLCNNTLMMHHALGIHGCILISCQCSDHALGTILEV